MGRGPTRDVQTRNGRALPSPAFGQVLQHPGQALGLGWRGWGLRVGFVASSPSSKQSVTALRRLSCCRAPTWMLQSITSFGSTSSRRWGCWRWTTRLVSKWDSRNATDCKRCGTQIFRLFVVRASLCHLRQVPAFAKLLLSATATEP